MQLLSRRDFLSSLLVSPLLVTSLSDEPGVPGSESNRRAIKLPLWRGVCVCTAYCPCSLCCGPFASGFTSLGKVPTEGYTVAADPGVFPYGTVLYIVGVGTRVVSDCGGSIVGNRLDIYFDDHNEALAFGRRVLKVRVRKDLYAL